MAVVKTTGFIHRKREREGSRNQAAATGTEKTEECGGVRDGRQHEGNQGRGTRQMLKRAHRITTDDRPGILQSDHW